MKIKLIMQAQYIPIGTTVYKATGEKSYVLKDNIRIFTESGTEIIQFPKPKKYENSNILFLVNDSDINIIEPSKELKIILDGQHDLLDFANDLIQYTEIPQ